MKNSTEVGRHTKWSDNNFDLILLIFWEFLLYFHASIVCFYHFLTRTTLHGCPSLLYIYAILWLYIFQITKPFVFSFFYNFLHFLPFYLFTIIILLQITSNQHFIDAYYLSELKARSNYLLLPRNTCHCYKHRKSTIRNQPTDKKEPEIKLVLIFWYPTE